MERIRGPAASLNRPSLPRELESDKPALPRQAQVRHQTQMGKQVRPKYEEKQVDGGGGRGRCGFSRGKGDDLEGNREVAAWTPSGYGEKQILWAYQAHAGLERGEGKGGGGEEAAELGGSLQKSTEDAV